MKDIKIFLEKKKKKGNSKVKNVTRISQKMKKIDWLSTEKNIIKCKKSFIIITRKYFNLKNFATF